MEAIEPWGFRRNGLRNLVRLPCDSRFSRLTGLPLHCGPHPRYTAFVTKRLVRIGQTLRATDHTSRDRYCAYERVSALQDELRLALLTRKTPGDLRVIDETVVDAETDQDIVRDIEATLRRLRLASNTGVQRDQATRRSTRMESSTAM